MFHLVSGFAYGTEEVAAVDALGDGFLVRFAAGADQTTQAGIAG